MVYLQHHTRTFYSLVEWGKIPMKINATSKSGLCVCSCEGTRVCISAALVIIIIIIIIIIIMMMTMTMTMITTGAPLPG